MSDNIKVVVKVRPLISRELEEKLSYQWRVKNNTLYQLDQNGRDSGSCFTFDKVYDKETNTSDIYNDIAKPIVEAAIAGFNGTIFAYGQTSSGKTYTMAGIEGSPGIIPLAVCNLFKIIKNIPDRDFLVRVSYIEIYNETLKDLLNVEKKNIKVHETFQGVKVDCTEQVTTSPEEVLKYLKEGEANRQTGATYMNEESSRSHSIFQITIESRDHIEGEEEVGCVNVSTLNLVDLAGSERAGQTGATGIRFKEGTHINKSLSALALVIKQLSEDQTKHVNYRDSKLTRILQNSLGGNAKTSIICAITPAAIEETISTLQFANRAKAIKNKPEVNAVATDATMIQSLTKQLSKLQSQLESKKNLEVMLESKKNVEFNLQKQIAALQRLILNGFGQTSSVDVVTGARRKLLPSRRITISTLHPIQEDPVPLVPKFHTPLLKYNPMLMPGSTDFVPIQNANKLASLPEEQDIRLVTPPPPEKRVGFTDEIIDLDSDDDNTSLDIHTCSPYHNCYGSSKTPPCILRKNAKVAEKNLKDIVELTEREKIYTPSVLELLEKLEENTSVIATLEDEVISLNKRSKEKDSEIDQLREKVNKSNEEVKSMNSAKAELETLCKEYSTKLTDWEVSYETLQNKTKRREEELLSLLEEQKMLRKAEDTGKSLLRNLEKEINFMDMSKDISLVNSDNESSITNVNDDDTTSQIQNLVGDMQNQLTSKNQTIIELESDLMSQKQKNHYLETSSQDLQKTIKTLQEKLSFLDNENSLLKSTLDTLNATIKSLKTNLESTNNDIESYNSLIQELQIKLTNKEKLLNININESILENMIANEEQFLANNDNIKNIIHSFKIALDSRNKEIESLKVIVNDATQEKENSPLQEQLNLRENENYALNEKVSLLQNQVTENIALIDKVIQEKNNLADIEHQISNKLATLMEINEQLETTNEKNKIQINELKDSHDILSIALANKEQQFLAKCEDVSKQIHSLNTKISELETEITTKDEVLAELKKEEIKSNESISEARSSLRKLQSILLKLFGNVRDFPDKVDNVSQVFSYFEESFVFLDDKISEMVNSKNSEIETYLISKTDVENTNTKLKNELTELQTKYEICNDVEKDLNVLRDDMQHQISDLIEERDELRKQIDLKTEENRILKLQASEYEIMNQNLESEVSNKNEELECLKKKESSFCLEMKSLTQEREFKLQELIFQINNLTTDLDAKKQEICEKDKEIYSLKEFLQKTEMSLNVKSIENEELLQKLNENISNESTMLLNILNHVTNLLATFNDCQIENQPDMSTYDRLLFSLNKVKYFVSNINEKGTEDIGNIEHILKNAENEMQVLTQQNDDLLKKISQMETENKTVVDQLEQIKLENKKLSKDLDEDSISLELLRKELKEKTNDIADMVIKTQNLNDQFTGLGLITKEQLEQLSTENEKLKNRCAELAISTSRRNSQESFRVDNPVESTESLPDNNVIDHKSPQSLLTICCNKIVDYIQPSEKSVSTTNSNISFECLNKNSKINICKCEQYLSDLNDTRIKNIRLSEIIERLEISNQNLIKEQKDVHREIELLVEPAFELQKKINSHKTNLSTLTATTYAENKSLKSQVKVLQHHHSRFHNVCQKDLPVVKKQLYELLAILKNDYSYFDKHNASFKRYSLPSVLDNTVNILKNESTLDGDLLMLDTNVTLATSVDNTLMGIDQTCLDLTQAYSNNDVACQTSVIDVVESEIASLSDENIKLSKQIEILLQENAKLEKQIHKGQNYTADVQTSPIKLPIEQKMQCKDCAYNKQREEILEKLVETIKQELKVVKTEKDDIEIKYNNLTLEIPSIEALVRKLSLLEKEYQSKMNEISKLTNTLNSKNSELKQLQQENDSLSTQVMENISETDDLNKELDMIKAVNAGLIEKCSNLERLVQEAEKDNKMNISSCPQSSPKEISIKSIELHSKLNRSLSDSETSSRYNKICTLQNEIHAGTQDCKELTEDVTTIKNHFERNNLSIEQNMDLDDSMGESNIFTITKHFGSVDSQMNKIALPNVKKDRLLDVYVQDKIDCINYFVEKTGADKENLNCNNKIIEIMKLFYNQCLTKHSNEVENLVNKLKCYEESRVQMESHVNQMSAEYLEVLKKMEEKENKIKTVTNVLSEIRTNLSVIGEDIAKCNDAENKHSKVVTAFRESVLSIMDGEFGFTSLNIFENLLDNVISKHQEDLTGIMERYTQLQEHMKSVTAELNSVNEKLLQMKCQLSDKENEYNLLKAQKERVHEISNAVTLDIVKKERELCDTITNGCKQLVENSIIYSNHFDPTLPLNKNINLLFERLVTECKVITPEFKEEKEKLVLEVKKSKSDLDDCQKSLDTLKIENAKLKEINHSVTLSLLETQNKLETQLTAHIDLTKLYENILKENETNVTRITNITDELNKLKESLYNKELLIQKTESEKLQKNEGLSEKEAKISELLDNVASLKQEISDLRTINEIVVKERDASALDLEQCKKSLNFNKSELVKMTSDILVLRESVKENSSVIDNLKQEAKSLLQQNLDIKLQLEEKCRDCSRLEVNIKTHEKTAEIQSRMIVRFQKQKEDDDKALVEKNKQIETLTHRNDDLQRVCETLTNEIKALQEELQELGNTKKALEMRLAEMELNADKLEKPRVSIDVTGESTRRRRQSIHDSKRMFAEDCGDHINIEAVFDSRPKPEDLFMDVDDDSSNRSTPLRNSRGRDSLLSKHDHSDKESEPPRANSAAAQRRRRQSTHDLRRSGVPLPPSPHERSSSRENDLTSWKTSDIDNNNVQSEMSQLRERLTACQQELEELKEKYRELDEECETCAQYLRERDDQCLRLKKEKAALENIIAELKQNLQSVNPNRSQQEQKRSFTDAAANTDEDWTNLHSVVVDRMSYDAEIEKNKRLTKTIDELRFKKQDLKNIISKMQKHIEKNAAKDNSRELERTKLELKECKQELKELKERYKELDEECETCAEYLRERDEQCRKLKEVKAALEVKLQEYEDNASKVTQSLRKKRQSIHDQNRSPAAHLSDATTETSEDFLSYQVERDDNPQSVEVKSLKLAVEKLSQQKSALEQQLLTISSAPTPNPVYVATGSAIVQNQQLTDVMKENQKLKKINTKLVQICKKRGKKSEIESIDVSEQS